MSRFDKGTENKLGPRFFQLLNPIFSLTLADISSYQDSCYRALTVA